MKIISFDGTRASGKSLQLSLLAKSLLDNNFKVKIIHEKNYEPFRSLALSWSKRHKSFSFYDIQDFARARAEVYRREVSPTVEEIDYLLFDRYFYTSAIYQQGDLSIDEVIKINLEEGTPNPNQSFIFVCNPILSFERMKKRAKVFESLEEITKRRELYIQLVQNHPELCLINTTDKNEDEVFEEVKIGVGIVR